MCKYYVQNYVSDLISKRIKKKEFSYEYVP